MNELAPRRADDAASARPGAEGRSSRLGGAGAGERILKLAILAVGGQGGGVLTSWVTRLAEENGFHAQSTSVPGVAQRTGATVYYVEMMRADPARPERRPVFALMPAEGDVDVVIAAELVEAGRAMLRRLVTPGRTTLIASSHRNLTVAERMAPGDGRADGAEVHATAARLARRFVCFDMDRIAKDEGTMISAGLFGALAGSGALPFEAQRYRRVVETSGRGVARSLAAFEACRERAEQAVREAANGPDRQEAARGVGEPGVGSPSGPSRAPSDTPGGGSASGGSAGASATVSAHPAEPTRRSAHANDPRGAPPTLRAASQPAGPAPDPGAALAGPARLLRAFEALRARVDAMPEPVRDMAGRGLAKVVDFQDAAYGGAYLDRLDRALEGDRAPWGFSVEAARHLANAMAYDDVIRVADLKTRAARAARVRREVGADPDAVLHVTEYFHPRGEEIAGLLPARLGRRLEARPRAMARLDRAVNRGRRLRTDRMGAFALLWCVGGLRRWRPRTLRHAREMAHLDAWLTLALETRARDPALGREVLRCRRLVKGYSDTHARGLSKYDRVLSALPMLEGRADAADWLRRLRDAALMDAEGRALDGALKTVATL